MSITSVPDRIRFLLWGKGAGRCQYEGCNRRLWIDDVTQAESNSAYIAHIVADSPNGPRGDPVLSETLKADFSNLMLMCDVHHRLIDKEDVEGHPVDRLRAMKKLHEKRIDTLAEIAPEKQSYVVLYGANIGAHGAPLSFREASLGMTPDRYPASQQSIQISLGNSSFEDSTAEYWSYEAQQIRNVISQQLKPRIKSGDITHISIFALAPQPLLMLLGSELSDIPFAETYQRRREPQSWSWEDDPKTYVYELISPSIPKPGDAALVFALSAQITDERVAQVLGNDIPIWRITISNPNNDFVRSRPQTEAFRTKMREVLDRIKIAQGEHAVIHVFPAMPVSLAVDFGRIINSKADLPVVVYDQNRKLGGFAKALEINASVEKS